MTLMTVIALASDSTTRRRVFRRYALDQSNITDLTQTIGQYRVAAYEGRLAQLANAMSINAEPSLYDPRLLAQLHQDARGSAASVVHTHNDDLRSFLAQQEKGISQRQLASNIREWEAQRQEWKSKQIALHEGYAAANQADKDVMAKNDLDVPCRVEPDTAECQHCVEAVDRGWMNQGDVDFDLPLHITCIHAWAYKESLADAIAGKDKVWLGDWLPMDTEDTELQLDDESAEDEPEGGAEDEVTHQFGSFMPAVRIIRTQYPVHTIHRMEYADDGMHIGTVVSHDEQNHAAVQWNGKVSEHDSLEHAVAHMAHSHGIAHELTAEQVPV